jgi:hypothetical protein
MLEHTQADRTRRTRRCTEDDMSEDKDIVERMRKLVGMAHAEAHDPVEDRVTDPLCRLAIDAGTEAADTIEWLRKEVEQWKANHDNQVRIKQKQTEMIRELHAKLAAAEKVVEKAKAMADLPVLGAIGCSINEAKAIDDKLTELRAALTAYHAAKNGGAK